jgi:hypothetical protein
MLNGHSYFRSDVKRLNKNRKQREREFNKKVYITKLKQVIIASDLIKVKPKGKKGFTEVSCSCTASLRINSLFPLGVVRHSEIHKRTY